MSDGSRQETSTPGINWQRLLTTFGPMFGLVFVWLLFAILVPIYMGEQSFITVANSKRILLQTAVVGTAAIGATLIIISGGIDLSVGSSIALGTMVIALVLKIPVNQTGPNRGEWKAGTTYQEGDVLQRAKQSTESDAATPIEYTFFKCLKTHQASEKRELGDKSLWLKIALASEKNEANAILVPGQGTVTYRVSLTQRMPIVWPLVAALAGVIAGVLVGLTIGAMVIGQVGRTAATLLAGTVFLWLWPHGWSIASLVAIVLFVAVLAWGEKVLGRLPLSPFIVTLGLWGALRGWAKGLGDNQPIYPDDNWLKFLMEEKAGSSFLLPTGVWIMAIVALLASGLLRYTRLGRHIFAIGSNEQTARLCGIHVERTKLLIYMLAIGCAGLAAVLQFSFLTIGDPTTAQGFELKVIAAVVIGGASLSGGSGSILGTICGALIMTVVANGCSRLNLDNWREEIVTGAIIVAAVALDEWRKRRSPR